jgi:AcrR family transcriptional regulator
MKMIIDDKKGKTKLPAVMRAAIHMFVRKGIHGTTIKDIAQEAGVAEGQLYRHFKSKDDLAWHLFQTHLNQFTMDLTASVFAEKAAKERIRAFVQASFAAYEEDRDLFTYLIIREHSELLKYAQTYAHPGHVVRRIIEEGQKAGDVRPGDSYLLGSWFVGAVIRVCVVRMYGDLKNKLTDYSAETADAVWAMLKAPRGA